MDRRALVDISFIALATLTIVSAGVIWQYRPLTWSPEQQITRGGANARIVDVLADPSGSLVHLVWEDDREKTNQVFYKRSLDDGVTWESDRKLTDLMSQTIEPLPRLVSNGQRIVVLFSNGTGTGEHIFYLASEDRGRGFSESVQLTKGLGYQTNPAASFAGSVLHVVWQNYHLGESHIYYERSLDSGVNWQLSTLLTDTNGQDRHPAICTIGQSVFVVWSRYDEGREAVFFKASYDSGLTWEPEIQLTGYEPPVFLIFPSIGCYGSSIHVIWNGVEVLYSRSLDAGVSWNAATPLTNSSREYLAPEISVSGSHLKVVTPAIRPEDKNATADIYYSHSEDNGNRWTKPVVLSGHGEKALSLAPAISVLDDSTFIAWQDNRNGPYEVFFVTEPDFAALHTLERRLVTPVAVILGVAIAALVLFSIRRPKKALP
jgi:hypothetical protein